MQRLVVHFPLVRYWVAGNGLKAYVSWSWSLARARRTTGARELLRRLWHPTLAPLPQDVVHAFGLAADLGLEPHWARYPTDGLRLQVFDAKNRQICKLLLSGMEPEFLTRELGMRRRVGDLAPRVIAVNAPGNAYVEEWVTAVQPAYSPDLLERVVRRLRESLYNTEWADKDGLPRRLARWGRLSDELEQVLGQALGRLPADAQIPWGMVHGDLVEANVLLDGAQKLLLVDWEHVRECVATYDCWLYVYDHLLRSREAEPQQLRKTIASSLQRLFGPRMDSLDPILLHAVHLVERVHYLECISPGSTAVIRQKMMSDLRAVRDSVFAVAGAA